MISALQGYHHKIIEQYKKSPIAFGDIFVALFIMMLRIYRMQFEM